MEILYLKAPKIGISYFSDANELVEFALKRERPVSLIALNAEKLVNLYDDETYLARHRSIIFYPDGSPITWFVNRNYPRLAGVEVWIVLLRKAIELKKRVFIIGSMPDVIEKCARALANEQLDKNVNFLDGFRDEVEYLDVIKELKPDFVFVALGTPKQERLMSKLQALHGQAVYMGIGGSLDILAGQKRRAPKCVRDLGLEFLYRLLREPRRIFRQQIYLRFILYYLTRKFME
jgi:UDP-N-acetyl-D-mannosaminouronate:lipid I N-acetyl-D-mannosaminouronosyltransferase